MTVTVAHLRPRKGEEPTTAVELFFDLVYVFAVTQLSHHLLADLTWAGAGKTAFLLFMVWWAWIYTTWMVNWFDPDVLAVRIVLVGVMLGSLLMAAALPEALGSHGALFAGSYVALQVGRNVAGYALTPSEHALRDTFERITVWSLLSAPLWIAGALVAPDDRLKIWLPAMAVEIAGPLAGYWMPRRGGASMDMGIEGSHFAERCQGFIIIALGESIVVTGATAADAGLTGAVVPALAIAFLGTAALWWLYFGEVAAGSRRHMAESEDAGRLARDAYTYLHVPIVAGVILAAVGDDLLIAHPGESLTTAGALTVCGGPALFLLGETFFRVRMIGSANVKRVVAIAALAAVGLLAPDISAIALAAIVVVILTALALWEYESPPPGTRPVTSRVQPAGDAAKLSPSNPTEVP